MEGRPTRRALADAVRRGLTPPVVTVLAGCLLPFLVLAAAKARFELRILRVEMPRPTAAFVVPEPGAARLIAAKYDEAAADVVWTRLLVYYGAETLATRDPEFAASYVRSITSLDPMFRAPYAWSGYAIPLGTTNYVSAENVEAAIRILRNAVFRFPYDAELHGMLGYNLFNELPRWITDGDRILRAKMEGAQHLAAQASLSHTVDWTTLAAAAALRDVNMDDLAAKQLEDAAFTTDDPVLRERILWRLSQLQAGTDMEAISRATATLEAFQKIRAPGVPESLFLLLSPRDAGDAMSRGDVPPPWPEDAEATRRPGTGGER